MPTTVDTTASADLAGQRGRSVEDARARTAGKSTAAFRTISEVSAELDVPQHVLRFWESKFSQLRPLKRGGGRRDYRPEDVALLRRIHGLLYREGYTIKGVQRVLRAPRKTDVVEAPVMAEGASPDLLAGSADKAASGSAPNKDALLAEILAELKILRALLD